VVQSVRLLGEQKRWDGLGWDKTEKDKETCFADSTRLHCSVEGGRRGHGRVVGDAGSYSARARQNHHVPCVHEHVGLIAFLKK
jgi:hypothetical protein